MHIWVRRGRWLQGPVFDCFAVNITCLRGKDRLYNTQHAIAMFRTSEEGLQNPLSRLMKGEIFAQADGALRFQWYKSSKCTGSK